MSLHVVELKTFASDTQKEIVEMAEKLLERAKKGDFEGLAIVASFPDGSCYTSYTRSMNFHALVSGLAILQHRMIATRSEMVDR